MTLRSGAYGRRHEAPELQAQDIMMPDGLDPPGASLTQGDY